MSLYCIPPVYTHDIYMYTHHHHSSSKKEGSNDDDEKDASSQLIGVTLLFISLCFDGGTGAYEDKLMSVHSVGPFDLMYNIQMGKTILAGIGLIVLNQVHVFAAMCQGKLNLMFCNDHSTPLIRGEMICLWNQTYVKPGLR